MSPEGNGHTGLRDWRESTRVVLQPIAAPSILGLFGFAGATFIVSAHLAGWYGGEKSGMFLFPFAAMFGGLAQFLAGMWSYKARDGLATAMHGMWGSFWLAFGILYALFATGALEPPKGTAFPELGFWFIALATITTLGFVAALAENLALAAVLGTLAAGSGLLAAAYVIGSPGTEEAGGWVLQVSAWLAAYTAGAMMLEATWGRVVLPTGKLNKQENLPGHKSMLVPIEYERAEPGVRQGQ